MSERSSWASHKNLNTWAFDGDRSLNTFSRAWTKFQRVRESFKRVFVLTAMAASPLAANGSGNVQDNEKWSTNDQAAESAPLANGAENPNGSGSHPDDHRDPQPDPVEGPESSPAPGSFRSDSKADGSHRGEKQIKVLVWSYFVSAVTPVSTS